MRWPLRKRLDWPEDLAWVPEWALRVRDHVEARLEDNLLIKKPNQAQRLNGQGARILKRVLEGGDLASILGPHAASRRALSDVGAFLLDVRRFLKEGIEDTYESAAVDKVRFEAPFSDLPITSEVALTYRCNASCVFCYAGCNCTRNPVGSSREMTQDELLLIFERIRHEAHVASVNLTGGEATLRADLPEIVRMAAEMGLRVNLVTNGIKAASRSYVETLKGAGLASAQVSLEGRHPDIHDRVTGVPGGFRKVLRAIENFRALGLPVHPNTTVTRANIGDLAGFPGFVARDLGLSRFSMNLVIPTGSAVENSGPPEGLPGGSPGGSPGGLAEGLSGEFSEELAVRYEEIGPYLDRLKAESEAEGIQFLWYSPTPLCIYNTIAKGLGNKGCAACNGLLSVGADGSLLPCASYDEPIGSLLDESFRELWEGERAARYRHNLDAPAACRRCDSFAACNGACPLYFRHVGYGELPFATKPLAREPLAKENIAAKPGCLEAAS